MGTQYEVLIVIEVSSEHLGIEVVVPTLLLFRFDGFVSTGGAGRQRSPGHDIIAIHLEE